MAQIQDNTHKRKRRSSDSSFLGCCFGFSRKVPEQNPQDTVKPLCRKKTRWLSWSRLQIKKPDVKNKTVPIDASVSVAGANRRSPIHPPQGKKNNSKHLVPATATQIPATLRDETVTYNPQKTRHEAAKNIIPEIHENSDDVGSLKDEKRPKLVSTGRQTEAKNRGICCPPGSPEKKVNPCRTIKTLSHSVSFPAPKAEKQAAADSREKQLRPERGTLAGKMDPVVGMSILMVIVVIMLVWGKLCAVLCTSAWFYFAPRLRNAKGGSNVSEENGSNRLGFGLDDQEYKKKVVLEGFLERKRRVPMPQ
ncbi:hypothetical protein U1Q18_029830 [Sarracenia purpurea var. burkii]